MEVLLTLPVHRESHFASSEAQSFDALTKPPKLNQLDRIRFQSSNTSGISSAGVSSPSVLSHGPSSDGFTGFDEDALSLGSYRIKSTKRSNNKRGRGSSPTNTSNDESNPPPTKKHRPTKSKAKKSSHQKKKQISDEDESGQSDHSNNDEPEADRGPGDNPSTRSFYGLTTRKLIDRATLDFEARIMTTDPFADETTCIAEANAAWTRTMKIANKKLNPTAGQIQAVSILLYFCFFLPLTICLLQMLASLGSLRSRIKSHALTNVQEFYKFIDSSTTDAIQANQEKAAKLLKQNNFTFHASLHLDLTVISHSFFVTETLPSSKTCWDVLLRTHPEAHRHIFL